jgi:signal peptidase II
MPKHSARWSIALLAALLTIGCDHAMKRVAASALEGEPNRSYAGDLLRLGYTENTGGFLSLGARLSEPARLLVFQGGAGLLLLGVTAYGIRRLRAGEPALGIALIAAGGWSNWIDRVVRGSVIDFLNVGIGPLRTGVFNVADVAIMFGAVLIILQTGSDDSAVTPATDT